MSREKLCQINVLLYSYTIVVLCWSQDFISPQCPDAIAELHQKIRDIVTNSIDRLKSIFVVREPMFNCDGVLSLPSPPPIPDCIAEDISPSAEESVDGTLPLLTTLVTTLVGELSGELSSLSPLKRSEVGVVESS